MFGYMMHTSDDVLEDSMTHKIVEGRVPEGDDMDQLYDELIKETKEMRPVNNKNNDIDMDLLCGYLIKEASKDET